MDITIHPGHLSGTVEAIPSKSQAHRLLICAAFADKETTLICPETNRDIEATTQCLRALGADIQRTDSAYVVEPIGDYPEKATLPCGESGSTLRFLLPIAGAMVWMQPLSWRADSPSGLCPPSGRRWTGWAVP